MLRNEKVLCNGKLAHSALCSATAIKKKVANLLVLKRPEETGDQFKKFRRKITVIKTIVSGYSLPQRKLVFLDIW